MVTLLDSKKAKARYTKPHKILRRHSPIMLITTLLSENPPKQQQIIKTNKIQFNRFLNNKKPRRNL